MKTALIVAIVVCACDTGVAGSEPRSILLKECPERVFTGNLQVDLLSRTTLADVPPLLPQGEAATRSHRSPFIAAGMSLVVPGAGEVYTEHYWEAAAFFAADVAAWLLAYKYDHKGDTQTDFFQNYANAHWDVVQYAIFSRNAYIPQSEWASYRLIIPGTEGRPPWFRVDWHELNRMEQEIGSTDNGRYYSHVLPTYGDQQYYELIGKYQEFYQGWDDADSTLVSYDQITQRLHDSPSHMIYYSVERGKANDYYNKASAWVAVAIVNHVVNAAYAALSAGWYNSAHAELGMQRVPSERGYTNVPVVKMRWEF